MWLAFGLGGNGLGHRGDGLHPGAAGEGIGIAGIDDQCARSTALQFLGTPIDWRRAGF